MYSLGPVAGQDMVTLLTCTPYAINSHRLLVHATRIPYDATAAPPKSTVLSLDWSLQPWMKIRVAIAGAALALLGLLVISWLRADLRERRGRRRARRGEPSSQSKSCSRWRSRPGCQPCPTW